MFFVIIESRYSRNTYTAKSIQEIIDDNIYSDCGASRVITVYDTDFIEEDTYPVLVGKPKKIGKQYCYIWSSDVLDKYYFSKDTVVYKSAYLENSDDAINYANLHEYNRIFDENGFLFLYANGNDWFYLDEENDQLPFDIRVGVDMIR